ncbi:putative sugar transporter [Astrocystis sublimbata]|nr:putative sugar transporter [Astrocystis sublimbata]
MTSTLSNRVRGGQLVALITFIDAMSACWFGYCQGVFAGVLVSPDFMRLFPELNNGTISGAVTSSFFLGAFVGAVVAFVLGDKLGRKKTIIAGHILNTVGAALQTSPYSLVQLVIGRTLNGIGIGITSTMSPVYLGECVQPHHRGRLLVIGASSNVSSFALANWVSYALAFRDGPIQWRLPLGIQLIFPFLIFPIAPFVPESPRWLLLVGREDEAKQVLARLNDESVTGESVTVDYNSIKASIRLERSHRVPLMDVLRNRDKTQNLRRLILSCGGQFMQQFTGINSLGFYLPTLLHESVGYSLQMSRLLAAINGTVYFVFAFFSLVVVDRVGRRKLMLYGCLLMTACHLISSLSLKAAQEQPSQAKTFGSVTVAFFVIYHAVFAPTWAGIPWVYAAEVNSIGWRTRGAGAATATNWLTGFAVVQFTKVGIDNLHWAFFLSMSHPAQTSANPQRTDRLTVFAVLCLLFFPVVYCFYPETARRKLEDMDEMFFRNPSWFVFGKEEMTQPTRPQTLVDAELARISDSQVTVIEVAPDKIEK